MAEARQPAPMAPTTTFQDIPAHLLTSITRPYLSLQDFLSLRLVSWHFRTLIDSECCFRVPLTNSSFRWVKTCVPYIHQVIVGPLTHPDFLQWPDQSFPEVEHFKCIPGVDAETIQKLFKVFPNVRDLFVFKLNGQEMISLLELHLDERSFTLMRNKLAHSIQLVTPSWIFITNLQIILHKVHSSHGEVFHLLSTRKYPQLTCLHLEYRLQGQFTSGYDQLHPIYIYWMEFISNHPKTLRKLTLRHDIGVDIEPQYVPQNPEGCSTVPADSTEHFQLTEKLQLVQLDELTLKFHVHESFANHAWNWNLNLLKWQSTLSSLTLDCSSSPTLRDPSSLKDLFKRLSPTLTTLDYISTSTKADTPTTPFPSSRITFDFAILKGCKNLRSLSVSRGWSTKWNAWGPPITFQNIQSIPKRLLSLKLQSENNKLELPFALWISKYLIFLERLYLPICMTKALVTNLLRLPHLKEFTLVRDYFSEIKVSKMVKFCEQTQGIQYYCPDIPYYDSSGRWLDLLIIKVVVDRSVFKIDEELVKKYPDVLH